MTKESADKRGASPARSASEATRASAIKKGGGYGGG